MTKGHSPPGIMTKGHSPPGIMTKGHSPSGIMTKGHSPPGSALLSCFALNRAYNLLLTCYQLIS